MQSAVKITILIRRKNDAKENQQYPVRGNT